MLKNNKLKAVKQVLKFEYHLVKKKSRDENNNLIDLKFPEMLALLSTFSILNDRKLTYL